MTLFFDLDGTLIDSRLRLYNLFQYLVPESNLSFDEYWQLKRTKQTHKTILRTNHNYQPCQIVDFEDKWMSLIEKDEWLKFDKPFKGITSYLTRLVEDGHKLYLVTHRQDYTGVLKQFKKFNWLNVFQQILVTEQKYSKAELIKPYLLEDTTAWMISDSGTDIIEGKSLNLKTAAVLCGFLNEDVLREYMPDLIAKFVCDLNLNKTIYE